MGVVWAFNLSESGQDTASFLGVSSVKNGKRDCIVLAIKEYRAIDHGKV